MGVAKNKDVIPSQQELHHPGSSSDVMWVENPPYSQLVDGCTFPEKESMLMGNEIMAQ
ncbi:unnamed protein product [Lupinus luteus]|uniref:Uncharacterized protein n=1 Tax=Lupinus luteus TaxID=3873 RepID=A0AAV1WCH7_LUPLU